MTTTDTNLQNLVINKLTKQQYDNIQTKNENEFYLVTDDSSDLPSQTGQSGKFLTTNGTAASWANVDALPTQTGQSGKFLTTNGTAASWATVTMPTVDQTYDGTSANAQSGVAIAGAGFLQNIATGSNALTINGVAATVSGGTNIGASSTAGGAGGTAIGWAAGAGASASALGMMAKANGNYSIQLGYGTNSTASTLCVGFNASSSADRKNWQLLDGTTGKIPNERINMDATPTSGSTNAVTSGGVYSMLGDIESALQAINGE